MKIINKNKVKTILRCHNSLLIKKELIKKLKELKLKNYPIRSKIIKIKCFNFNFLKIVKCLPWWPLRIMGLISKIQ